MAEINILHISDIHCGIENSTNTGEAYYARRKKTLDLFFSCFYKIPSNWRPDIIAITGDLGWSGKSFEYKRDNKESERILYTVSEFLEKLREETKREGNNIDIICCPGNHDKDECLWSDIQYAREGEDNFIIQDIQKMLPGFQEYAKAMKETGVLPLKNAPLHKLQEDEYDILSYIYGYYLFERASEKILFVVLNSAWLCDHRAKDLNKLELGRNQILEVIRCIKNEGISADTPVVIMFHHPIIGWLKTTEFRGEGIGKPDSIGLLVKEFSNVIFLQGHQHQSEGIWNKGIYTSIAGTIGSRETRKAECYIIKLLSGDCPWEQTGVYRLVEDKDGEPLEWMWEERESHPIPINLHYYFESVFPNVILWIKQALLERERENTSRKSADDKEIASEQVRKIEFLLRLAENDIHWERENNYEKLREDLERARNQMISLNVRGLSIIDIDVLEQSIESVNKKVLKEIELDKVLYQERWNDVLTQIAELLKSIRAELEIKMERENHRESQKTLSLKIEISI